MLGPLEILENYLASLEFSAKRSIIVILESILILKSLSFEIFLTGLGDKLLGRPSLYALAFQNLPADYFNINIRINLSDIYLFQGLKNF